MPWLKSRNGFRLGTKSLKVSPRVWILRVDDYQLVKKGVESLDLKDLEKLKQHTHRYILLVLVGKTVLFKVQFIELTKADCCFTASPPLSEITPISHPQYRLVFLRSKDLSIDRL